MWRQALLMWRQAQFLHSILIFDKKKI